MATMAIWPATARAHSGGIIDCPKDSYSLATPISWGVTGSCANLRATAPQDAALISIEVERHGWWSDARSISSISNDVAVGHTFIVPLKITRITLNGRTFMQGTVGARSNQGTLVTDVELETFAHGHLYKISGEARATQSGGIVQAQEEADAAIGTLVIL